MITILFLTPAKFQTCSHQMKMIYLVSRIHQFTNFLLTKKMNLINLLMGLMIVLQLLVQIWSKIFGFVLWTAHHMITRIPKISIFTNFLTDQDKSLKYIKFAFKKCLANTQTACCNGASTLANLRPFCSHNCFFSHSKLYLTAASIGLK